MVPNRTSQVGKQRAALDAVAPLLTKQSQATSPLIATVADLAASAVATHAATRLHRGAVEPWSRRAGEIASS